MSGDDEKKVQVRAFTEYSGFKTLAAADEFLTNIGKGIDDVEKIVSDVNTGFSILLGTSRRVVAALSSSPSIDDVIDYHRREIELLEEKKRKIL